MSLSPLSAALEAMARRGEWEAHFPDGARRVIQGRRAGDQGPDVPPDTFRFFRVPNLRETLRSDAERVEPETITLHAIRWSHVTRVVEYGTEAWAREVARRRAAALAEEIGTEVWAREVARRQAPAPSLLSQDWQGATYVPDWKTPEGEE